tara:strand:- start:18663 stop:19352 length:690 start_codon:yes stop_codon:yes gene_type:complete
MKKILLILLLILSFNLVSAATLEGSVYGTSLELEKDVLLEIGGQKYLSKDGGFSFELEPGEYALIARNSFDEVSEEVVVKEGKQVYDVFLLGLDDEESLWKDTELFTEEETSDEDWRYWIAGAIAAYALIRFFRLRKKHGSVHKFRKRIKAESKKSLEQHKKELRNEPGYIDKALDIIKQHDGRISQKELRKEMLYLSEAKVSLIVTELEHKGLVEKVKKGRGNVIFLK